MLVLSKFTLFIHFVYTNGIKAELLYHTNLLQSQQGETSNNIVTQRNASH